jgi:hypothetical protein
VSKWKANVKVDPFPSYPVTMMELHVTLEAFFCCSMCLIYFCFFKEIFSSSGCVAANNRMM